MEKINESQTKVNLLLNLAQNSRLFVLNSKVIYDNGEMLVKIVIITLKRNFHMEKKN